MYTAVMCIAVVFVGVVGVELTADGLSMADAYDRADVAEVRRIIREHSAGAFAFTAVGLTAVELTAFGLAAFEFAASAEPDAWSGPGSVVGSAAGAPEESAAARSMPFDMLCAGTGSAVGSV